MAAGPLDLVIRIAQILDELGIPYALGGSLASSLFGEPRSTVDVDVAIRLEPHQTAALLEHTGAEFYVPVALAREAIQARSSFNLVDTESGLKIDLFVLGDDLLDRRQIDRRIRVTIPGARADIWVTSPEDQILRKLAWYRDGDAVSDRQWRDVIGILRSSRDDIDIGDLTDAAHTLGLGDLLAEALAQAS